MHLACLGASDERRRRRRKPRSVDGSAGRRRIIFCYIFKCDLICILACTAFFAHLRVARFLARATLRAPSPRHCGAGADANAWGRGSGDCAAAREAERGWLGTCARTRVHARARARAPSSWRNHRESSERRTEKEKGRR